MSYDIFFPTSLNSIDSHNDNIDVCLRLEDGREYTFVVATPDNLKKMMNDSCMNYLQPCSPFLFVSEITEHNVIQLVEDLLQRDEVLLNIYGGDL